MNLVRWFRKNNKKVMAVVVIVLMFGFVGGSALQRFLQSGRGGLHETAAYFGDNKKITNYDLAFANQELEILKMLQADTMLRSILEPVFRVPDLRSVLLGELLFSDRRASPALLGYIRQIITTNKYRVSSKQINDIYRRSVPGNVYWALLKKEAEFAGIKVSNEDAGRYLGSVIPKLSGGSTYATEIGRIVRRRGIPEKEVLETFGKLLAVLSYARTVCSGEDVTTRQIMHGVSWAGETIDVELVRFESSLFAETQDEPTDEEISTHFERYKKFFTGAASDENPYGFGYKLSDRVRLEYLAVRLDEVSDIITQPTQEEAEEYYQKNRERFTEEVPSDPNDPNSPPTERTKSYAEVASTISELLKREKINSKAEMILQEAKGLTERAFENADMEPANLSAEQLRELAGEYEAAAEELSKKHKIKIYTGRTGLLNATDIQVDEYLGRLYVRGQGYNVLRLSQVVFAVDELGTSELGPFDAPKPKMYENIGPARDVRERIMAVMRVTEAEKASEPESVDQTLDKNTLKLEQTEDQATEAVYSVREKVVEDLRKLAAMGVTKSKAQEFRDLAISEGWDSALEKFNELYGKADANEADPNSAEFQLETNSAQESFRLQSLTNLRRISSTGLGTLAVQQAGIPDGQLSVDMAKKESRLRELLYSIVPADSNSLETAPLVIEFKPDLSYYCLKSVSVRRINRDQYEQSKVMEAYREGVTQAQTLAAVHFNPENILQRMNFRSAGKEKEATDSKEAEKEKETTGSNLPAESNTPEESGAAR